MSLERTISNSDAGQRLDRWLKAQGIGFAQLQKWLRTGQVRVNGKRAEGSFRLNAGDTVRLPPFAALSVSTPGQRLDLSVLAPLILAEDEELLVLNKPAGLATQGGTGQKNSVDALVRAVYGNEAPKLTHRLDKDTSGVLVLAKSREAAAGLAEQFAERHAEKTYWAVVVGKPAKPRGSVDAPLLKVGERMEVDPSGQDAITQYATLGRHGQYTWLTLHPLQGRTHQVRVHCADLKTPILGDTVYGLGEKNTRLHLHARRLKVRHPITHVWQEWQAPLPPHMIATWGLCGWDEGATE
ncbi:MAG: RluA family pseudouridine synthase [Holosporales bacterium]